MGRGLTVPAQREPLPEINKLVSRHKTNPAFPLQKPTFRVPAPGMIEDGEPSIMPDLRGSFQFLLDRTDPNRRDDSIGNGDLGRWRRAVLVLAAYHLDRPPAVVIKDALKHSLALIV
jgi:hypothetical protein